MTGDDVTQWTLLARAAIAMLLAGALGWEREYRQRPAGLRTHMLVGLSAALFAGLGELYITQHRAGEPHADPLRVLEAVVTGVSFLGAGTVFMSKRHGVQGLTTAATLWTASAVGVASGVGEFIVAVGTTLLALVVLIGAGWLEARAPKDPEAAEEPAGGPPQAHAEAERAGAG